MADNSSSRFIAHATSTTVALNNPLERMPEVAELGDTSSFGEDKLDGKRVQLQDHAGNKLFPVCAGHHELLVEYEKLALKVFDLERRLRRLETNILPLGEN